MAKTIACSVGGCDKPRKYHGTGWCGVHDARWRANGTLERQRDGYYDHSHRNLPEVDRFWTRVEVGHPLGCWEWTGGKTSSGYGAFAHEPRQPTGKLTQSGAHRYAYQLTKGPIPNGLQIDHLCKNRGCVNPDHLEAVTGRENTLRSAAVSARNARATECVNGHPFVDENVWRNPKTGARHCRPCMRRRWHEWNERRQVA